MAAESKAGNTIRKRVTINGVLKQHSHYVWFKHTDYWPDYETKGEVVHHIDGNPSNDEFGNLQLMTEYEHNSLERRRRLSGEIPYKRIWVNGVLKYCSHYIWYLNTGHWPDYEAKREIIHHIDGGPQNDSFSNLQLMISSEHDSFHRSGENNPMYGKTHSAETKQRMSEAQREEKHIRWQGDSATAEAKYHRHRRNPDLYPPLTEEERKERNECQRRKKRERKQEPIK